MEKKKKKKEGKWVEGGGGGEKSRVMVEAEQLEPCECESRLY